MKPVMQSFDGINDNCLQMCIASLFELDMSDVPHFVAFDKGNGEYLDVFNRWLLERGFQALTLYLEYLDDSWTPNGYHLMYGKSRRGIKHSVVGYQGKMVYDPHPDQSGLESVESYTVFVSTLENTGQSP